MIDISNTNQRIKPRKNSRKVWKQNVNFSLRKQLFIAYNRIRSRSINTKKNHHCIINDISKILNRNFHHLKLVNLKQRHISKIVEEWKNRGYKPGTLATKIGFLRKLCNCIHKNSCIKDNKFYGINRGKVEFRDKRWTHSTSTDFAIIENVNGSIHKYGSRIKDCFVLERLFGLRKREALKFNPHEEIKIDENGIPLRIELTLGTKNNRHRTIPVVTEEQRSFLTGILTRYKFDPIQPFPPNEYKKWERIYYYVLDKIGINHNSTGHGLRQSYANERCKALFKEVKEYSEINNFNESDEKIRLVAYQKLTQELGHGRIDILKSYLADYQTPQV